MDFVDPILDEVAAISGVPRDQLVVTRAEGVTWPNPGLGCPEPGLAYPDVLVEGYWVVVLAGGREFDFRAGPRGEFRHCTIPKDERSGPVNST